MFYVLAAEAHDQQRSMRDKRHKKTKYQSVPTCWNLSLRSDGFVQIKGKNRPGFIWAKISLLWLYLRTSVVPPSSSTVLLFTNNKFRSILKLLLHSNLGGLVACPALSRLSVCKVISPFGLYRSLVAVCAANKLCRQWWCDDENNSSASNLQRQLFCLRKFLTIHFYHSEHFTHRIRS